VKVSFIAPNRPLSINEANRMHWASRRRRLAPWREATREALALAGTEELKAHANQRLHIAVTLPFDRGGRRDPHNYTSTNVKTIVDAIVSSGLLIPDDTAEWAVIQDPQLLVDKTGRVDIVITPTNPQEER